MAHIGPTHGVRCALAQPSRSHSDQSHSAAKHSHSGFNTGFRDWLRKITSNEQGSMQVAYEQFRLDQLKRLFATMLGTHIMGMSRRDLRLYLKVISALQIATIQELRFECFDLMCRKISEPVAVQKLREMDVLLG